MLSRRILRSRLWISGARYACAHTTTKPAPPPSPNTDQNQIKNPFKGFSSRFFISPSISLSNLNHINNLYAIRGKFYCTQVSLVDDIQIGGVVEIPLAQTGEGIAECELLKWFVQQGDQVEEFQPLCEVQSDKATIEITSRYKGKVSEILCECGDIVKVGETLLKMIVEESQSSSPPDGLSNSLSSSPETLESCNQLFSTNKHNTGGVLSTPAVRNLAKKHGIDINKINGSGKDGRVLEEDVLKYAANKEPSALSSASSVVHLMKEEWLINNFTDGGQQYEDKTVTLRGFQRAMVKTMTMAAKVPHFHYLEEINCDALVDLKAAFQKENSDPDVKHTYLPFLMKSLSAALSKYPLMNSSFMEESYEVILKGSHNIGIAMATPYGLVVPNIKSVQSLSLLEITKEISRLQQLALSNKLSSDDISGGTITLSNIGAVGGKFGSPLLNLPEVAIIAIGRIQKLPRFADDGSVYAASIVNVNIGADHRVVDGATVARFCNEWKLYIEKPELLMLHMR